MIDRSADAAVFLGDFGESVRFRAHAGATPRTLTANVHRQPLDAAGTSDAASPFAGRRSPRILLLVRIDPDHGVTPAELQADVSEFDVAFPVGTPPRWRRYLRIERQSATHLLVEVQS